MTSLYFLSMFFRFTFSDGVISSSSMVKSRASSAKRRIFSCRSRFLLKRSSSSWKICRTRSFCTSSARELLEVRHDERGEQLPPVADEHRRADVRRALEQRLQRLRGDVLPVGVDDDVFLAVGDFQEAVAVDLADVAGVKPPVLVDG